ncbi:hypothetical protein ACIOC1_30790 [Streptomyces sp. NPDC088197]|uniref:hypothetical protein n=1 Tax=Streptomyces sp. NPDC088197 TaxID=3365840 RepID=UPI00380CA67A
MDLVTSPWEPAERVEFVRKLAGKGDLAELSRALLVAKDPWHEGFGVTTVLRSLPKPDRFALAQSFVENAAAESADTEAGNRGLVLLAAVSRDIANATWCEAWEALLTEMADQTWSCGISDELWTCSHALLDADRRLPDAVVGLLRRSALDHGWPPECVTPVLTRLRGPVLNPGEPWADAVLASLPSLGDLWPGFIDHALLSPVARPTLTWDRRALALTAPIDTELLRLTLTAWLDLAADGGGRGDGGYDRYNLPALAGLTWLLSLLPSHPSSIRTLGALVEGPSSRTPLTSTAIRALARVPQRRGHPELERLSVLTRDKVTQRQIREALIA